MPLESTLVSTYQSGQSFKIFIFLNENYVWCSGISQDLFLSVRAMCLASCTQPVLDSLEF